MNLQTPSQTYHIKFLSNNTHAEVYLNELQEQLTIRLSSLKTNNLYESTFTNTTLPEELKTLLSNVKTVYDYIEVNKANPQKVVVMETGHLHLVFMLAFGPQSQIKKEFVLEVELKEIGKVDGLSLKELSERLRDEMMELNNKNREERDKLKAIILSVEKTNQKLVCQSEQLKLLNIQFKQKIQILDQKVTSLEILLKDLYTKYYTLKEQKQNIQNKLEKTKLVAILPAPISDPAIKKEFHSIFQDPNTEQDYLRKIKALEEQRDEQRRIFEEKIFQKQKNFNAIITSLEKTQTNTPKKPKNQVETTNTQLKDSEIQKLKNDVSPSSSEVLSDKIDKQFFLQDILVNDLPNITETKRKIGFTGKYYCGRTLCPKENCPKCKTLCGPNLGENCAQCMKIDIEKKGLKEGFLVNGNGQVSRMEKGGFCCGIGLENGTFNCGVKGKYCQACLSLSEVYEHRYKEQLNYK